MNTQKEEAMEPTLVSLDDHDRKLKKQALDSIEDILFGLPPNMALEVASVALKHSVDVYRESVKDHINSINSLLGIT